MTAALASLAAPAATAGPKPLQSLPARNHIIVGDASAALAGLASSSIDMALTSPPYFRLRDYQVDGQLGLEGHVDDWVHGLLGVTRQIHRLLVPSGTFWLNLGDSFAVHSREGAPRKSLLLGPEKLTLAMVADGWVLRNKLVWAKTNPRPSSVADRLTCSWEPIYLFAASSTPGQRTFFDLDAIRVPHRSQSARTPQAIRPTDSDPVLWRGPNGHGDHGLSRLRQSGRVGHVLGKNPGDVWQLSSSSFRGAHHATFPVALAERMIRAGCPLFRCRTCRQPWSRAARQLGRLAIGADALKPGCACQPDREPGVVLDPFMGAGTTAVAAEQLGRDWVGIELNPDFAALANRRIVEARVDRRARGQP